MWKCVGAPHLNTFPYISPIPLPTSFLHTPTHTLTHFPTPHPFLSPHLSPSRQHTSPLTPYTFPHSTPHFSTPHTSFLTHPHTPTHFSTPPPTPPIPLPTAPYTSTHFPTHPMHSPTPLPHIFPHSLDYVAKLPHDGVSLINLTELWKSQIKFFSTTGNLKSCFSVGNLNFPCMKVWRSYHAAKLLSQSYHVAKLLATI